MVGPLIPPIVTLRRRIRAGVGAELGRNWICRLICQAQSANPPRLMITGEVLHTSTGRYAALGLGLELDKVTETDKYASMSTAAHRTLTSPEWTHAFQPRSRRRPGRRPRRRHKDTGDFQHTVSSYCDIDCIWGESISVNERRASSLITYATMDRRSDRRCNPGFSFAGAIGDPPLSPSCNDHIAGTAAVTILGVYTVPQYGRGR